MGGPGENEPSRRHRSFSAIAYQPGLLIDMTPRTFEGATDLLSLRFRGAFPSTGSSFPWVQTN